MACKGHTCYFLDSQTHRWTQAASGVLFLGPAHRKNSCELLISQEGTLPLIRKKKEKADQMAKNTKDFTFNKNSVSSKRHI